MCQGTCQRIQMLALNLSLLSPSVMNPPSTKLDKVQFYFIATEPLKLYYSSTTLVPL